MKLDQSTSQDQHVDDTNEGPLTRLPNSVVDHRSLYVQISILNKQVETVCDSGASVSCLSEKLFKEINENHQVKIQQSTTRLSIANQMPIQIKDTVSVPIKIGPKMYEHIFHVFIEAAFDYEIKHRPGKSIGHADGLSRIPIVNQKTTSQSKEKPDEPAKTKIFEFVYKNGNLFESKDPLAH